MQMDEKIVGSKSKVWTTSPYFYYYKHKSYRLIVATVVMIIVCSMNEIKLGTLPSKEDHTGVGQSSPDPICVTQFLK